MATVTFVMEPVLPGHYAVATAAHAEGCGALALRRLANGPAGEPGTAEPAYVGEVLTAPVVQRKGDCLTLDIPDGAFGAYALSVPGEPDVRLVNLPRLDWIDRTAVRPGQAVRLIGRGLVSADRYPQPEPGVGEPLSHGTFVTGATRVVMQPADGGLCVEVPVERSSAYEAALTVPALPPGAYDLYAHNGLGGAAGWSAPLRLTVAAAEAWPAEVFRVDDYLTKGGTADQAIAAAVQAITANGGGVLEFGPRNYHITRTIVLPPRTVLRGAGQARTLIAGPLHSGPAGPWVMITGDRDFTVEDVRLQTLFAPVVIAAPYFAPDTFDGAFIFPNRIDFTPGQAHNVTIRRCTIHQLINMRNDRRQDADGGAHMARMMEFVQTQGQGGGGFQAICLRGDDLVVEDNTIYGGGACVMLFGCAHARVSRNRLVIGPTGHGIYAMGKLTWPEDWATNPEAGGAVVDGRYCREILVEDNEITSSSEFARDGLYLIYGAMAIHVARNDIHDIGGVYDSEGLGMHLWSARWDASHLEMFTPTRGRIIDPAGELTRECLEGAFVDIVEGTGVGQLRRISRRDGDLIELEEPLACPPDETSRVVFTAPPPFYRINLVQNRVCRSGANMIMWGCSNDCVADGNISSEGPGLHLWSVRLEADQKVYGGAAFTLMAHNIMDLGYTVPAPDDLLSAFGSGVIGNPCCKAADATALGYDLLGWIIRDNLVRNNSGIVVRKSFGWDKNGEPGIDEAGIVVEHNHAQDSHIGVVLEEGLHALARDNTAENVDHPLTWAKPKQVAWQ